MEYFGYFADQERYEAEQELNDVLDREDNMVRLHEQEMSPEVVE